MNESFCDDYVGEPTVLDESTEELQLFSFTLLVIGITTILLSYGYFVSKRRNYEFTKNRNLFLLTVFMVGSLVLVINFCLKNIIGSVNYSCRVLSLMSVTQGIFLFQVSWIRLFSLLWRINYNKLLINKTYLAMRQGDLDTRPGGSVKFVSTLKRSRRRKSYYDDVFQTPQRAASIGLDNQPAVAIARFPRVAKARAKFLSFILFDVLRRKSQKDLPLNIRIAEVFASLSFASFLFMLLFVVEIGIFLFIEFYTLPFDRDCANCGITPSVIVLYSMMGLTVLLSLYSIWRLRKVHDTFGIVRELATLGITFTIETVILFSLEIFYPEPEEDARVDYSLLTVIYIIFAVVYIFPYQVWKAGSILKRSRTSDSDEDLFNQTLASKEGKKAFSLFLASSLSLENLFFFDVATKWKADFEEADAPTRQETANAIHAQFLEEDAFLLINVSDECKLGIEQDLISDLKETTFDSAIEAVREHMIGDIFPRFKKTAYFKASNNELQDK